MSDVEFSVFSVVARAGSCGASFADAHDGKAARMNALANLSRKGLVECRRGRFFSLVETGEFFLSHH